LSSSSRESHNTGSGDGTIEHAQDENVFQDEKINTFI